MVSIENSSDPSCSSSKASDLGVSGHEDHPQPAPKFSIRDYVFRARSKDIRINWPFHEQLLQLCLDNGITDLLPPLQSRSVVKSYCVKNKTVLVSGEAKDDVELESLLPLDSSVSVPKEKRKFNVKLDRTESENNASSLTGNIVVSSEENLGDQSIKNKCRLAEDLTSNLSAVSDPMASKICPVCKLFTSSSNTTLNAHIDQCLSSDQSNAMKDTTQFCKSKVKPRKKRLMVDIYKTAPRCTLKDLDRRNGTNWAGSSTVVAPASDVNLETKRPKFSPSDVTCEGNVGDIYVDSNGTKLLILSKFNDSPPPASRKNLKPKKHGKGYTGSPSCSTTKTNILKPKCSKLTKDNCQSRKSSPVEGFKGKIAAAAEIECSTGTHQEKEESPSHLLNAHDQVKDRVPSTLGHWVCSKRSNLTRKLVNNDTRKSLENMIVIARKLSFKHTQTEKDHSYVERLCALNRPSSSEPLKYGDTSILSQLLKNCNSTGEGDCFDASPRPSSPDDGDHPSPKPRKSLTLNKSDLSRTCMSFEGMKVDERERLVTPKKFKKRRSILACSKLREGERYSEANGASHGTTEDFDISSRANKRSKIHSSILSENQGGGCLDATKDPVRSTDLEHVGSISRDEIQVESPTQRTIDNQEVRCEDAISNEVINQDIQISVDQAEPTLQNEDFQKLNPRFTGDGDTSLENTQENKSTTFVRVKPNQDHSTIVDIEVSGFSEVSNTSTISPPSPMHDDSKAEQFSSLTARKDNKVDSSPSPSPRESSCSCSGSLSRESHLSNHTRKNAASNVFMKPPTLDSPKPCSQPASNPILRLMGKDLVVSKEESVQMPNIIPCSTHYTFEPKFIAFGVPHNVGFIGYNNYHNYQMQTMGNQQFANSPLMVAQAQHRPPRPLFPSTHAQEVIVIDDDSHGLDAEPRTNFTTLPPQTVQNSNIMAPQRLFACIPSQNLYTSRAFC